VLLSGLLEAGVDLRAYLGNRDGQLVASCVVLRKGDRLLPKWAGFDYAMIGERSGVYFSMVLNAPVRDAYTEGLRWVEFGAGAHQAKNLRGCQARQISTALLLADPSIRRTTERLTHDFGQARRVAFGDQPAPTQLTVSPTANNGACCGSG
jgi:predicted N-acyltransferase